ncbi:MAG: DUF488 family protein [Proteobacteria bacterium]|nr:DUF488 family protein [Pseudomonadota bacterium]
MGSDLSKLVNDHFSSGQPPRPIIYSLGTSTRTLPEFTEILDSYRILQVVDVRRFPTSRLDHFKKANLEAALRGRGLEYVYLGDDLGGYRKGGYDAFMDSQEFTGGLETLISVAKKGTTVFVCAERFAWKCHRRFIGLALQKKGWQVVHLIEREKTWIPRRDESRDRP